MDYALAALQAASANANTGKSGQLLRQARREEHAAQSELLRDVFGLLPFRSVTVDPAWLSWGDGLLVSMARRMNDSRDFSEIPVLADDLEEAGCADTDILGHLRGPGPHVLGCWAVDVLLQKS